MGRRLTHTEFTEKANIKHNYKFQYPEEYINKHTPIKIICPKHGDTYQKPESHLQSVYGCPDCALEASRYTVEDVKEVLNKVHDFKYDYSLITSIENIRTEPLKILCKDHGVFEQMYVNHYQGCGCQTCANERKSFTKEIIFNKIKEKYGDLYDYSQAEYTDYYTPMKIICKNHGEFWQSPIQHLNTVGCKECLFDSMRLTWDDFIIRANEKHNSFYSYPKNYELKSNKDNVPIICPKHGLFPQTASGHLTGHGCPHCVNKVSKPEVEVQDFVKNLGFEIETNKRKYIKPYELDIYIPELNKAIEFNGRYWHYSDKHFVPGKHANKSNLCRQKGIRLLHIREDLWIKDQSKMKEVIMKFLEYK